jgi:hypothetical protein
MKKVMTITYRLTQAVPRFSGALQDHSVSSFRRSAGESCPSQLGLKRSRRPSRTGVRIFQSLLTTAKDVPVRIKGNLKDLLQIVGNFSLSSQKIPEISISLFRAREVSMQRVPC